MTRGDLLRGQRMCLCGVLAAEYETLPSPIRDAVIRYFDMNEEWLETVLQPGRQDGTRSFAGSPRAAARLIVGGLEGAMLLARSYGDISRYRAAAKALLESLADSST